MAGSFPPSQSQAAMYDSQSYVSSSHTHLFIVLQEVSWVDSLLTMDALEAELMVCLGDIM
jgi:hypothetical protein